MSNNDIAEQHALLALLSDDLLLPLVHIKTKLELLAVGNKKAKALEDLLLTTESGIHTLEAYRLMARTRNTSLPLEPVAIGAILQDVANELYGYAKQYNIKLEVDIKPNLKPVLAHKSSFIVAIRCLVSSFIRAQAGSAEPSEKLVLGAHRGADSVVTAGIFGGTSGLSQDVLKSARKLQGRAHQPLRTVPVSASGGILIADTLCAAMQQPLRVAKHNSSSGLATSFLVSNQLALV